ncbi:hypothetical protein TSOC_011711 [Tetrabaena socialis]|uniref:PARP-type domain-containing protein n=1 Tax=Tetrabaena socialis TaxID=47790 RepID=A0A2J7ZPY3_9CHLO|nr:hypothetical protein TSOC_011711 [Tetrabaena socialis]|eukprot:PNH02334.1 hypothetical protein TSOC_011711 [Tetrabaena socialis]
MTLSLKCALLLLGSLICVAVAEAPLPHVDDCFTCQKCHVGKPPGRRLLLSAGPGAALSGADAQQGGLADPAAGDAAAVGQETDPQLLPRQTADGGGGGGSGGAVGSGGGAGLPLVLPRSGGGGGRGGGDAGGGEVDDVVGGGVGRWLLAASPKEPMYVPPGFRFNNMPTKAEIAAKQAKANCSECYGCGANVEPLQAVLTQTMGESMRTEVGASPEWLFFADLPDTPTTGKKAVLKVWCMPIDKVHGTFSWRCTNTGEGAVAVQFLMAQQKVMEECGLMDVTIKLSYKRTRSFSGTMLNMMGERLNKSRVVRAALYDLLSSQCDRHAQNVFLGEDGNIKLIDNMQAMQFSWTNCAMDSVFLPGTQKNMIARWGGNLVFKARGGKARKSVNPMVVLDYRCYVPGGKIGVDYDPQLKQCLTKISGMTAREVQVEYGFPFNHSAAVLQQRATDMLHKGFEWTLRYGRPRSYKPKSYRPMQPCCSLNITSKYIIQCGHPWPNEPLLPYGDPLSGGLWRRPYPDSGTYEGGSFLDEPAEAR